MATTLSTFETQSGYREYVKDKIAADVFRVAAIEAEAISMMTLGTEYRKYTQAPAQTASNIYYGEIIGQNDIFIIQKITPLHTVRHLKRDLPHVPQIGQDVRIAYSAGICRIDKNFRHVRKRTHRIAL